MIGFSRNSYSFLWLWDWSESSATKESHNRSKGSVSVRQCVVGLGMIMKGIYSENLRHNLDFRSAHHRRQCWLYVSHRGGIESNGKHKAKPLFWLHFGCLCATIVWFASYSYSIYICVHSFSTLSTQPLLLFLIYAFIMFRLWVLLYVNVCDSKTLWFEGQSL